MKPAYFPVLILFNMFCSVKRATSEELSKEASCYGDYEEKKKYDQLMQMNPCLNLEDICEGLRRFSERESSYEVYYDFGKQITTKMNICFPQQESS